MMDASTRMVGRQISEAQLRDLKRCLTSEQYGLLRIMWHNRATAEAIRGSRERAQFFDDMANFKVEDLEDAMESGEVWAPKLLDPNPGMTGIGAPLVEP